MMCGRAVVPAARPTPTVSTDTQTANKTSVVSLQAQSKKISTQLATVLADDLQWSILLSAAQAAAPADLQIGKMSGALSAGLISGAGTSSAGAAQLPSTSGHETIGTLTITGTAVRKSAVAAYIDTLGHLTGLGNPLLTDLNLDDAGCSFTVKVDITTAALGGRYAAATTGSGTR